MVSIVIPVYNVEKYLDACIQSVLRMNTQLEIILVDDGSTDGSGALCDRWSEKDNRILVVHQKNGGLSAARNTGIRNASGEFVMFLDSDDFLDPNEADRLLSCIDPKGDVMLGLYRKFYTSQQRFEPESCDALLACQGLTEIESFLKAMPADGRSCYMTAWRFVLRRTFLLENDLFFMPRIYHEDEEWTLRLLTCADYIFITHHYFYQYRQAREGAITSVVKPKQIWDTFLILDVANSLLSRLPEGSSKATYVQNRMAQMYLSNMISARILSSQDKKAAYEKLDQHRGACAEYMTGTIGECAKICQKILGTRFTCFALRLARNIIKADS